MIPIAIPAVAPGLEKIDDELPCVLVLVKTPLVPDKVYTILLIDDV